MSNLEEKAPEQLAAEAIALLYKPGDVVELRIMGTNYNFHGVIASGYYDDFAKLARAIAGCSDGSQGKGVSVESCYLTLNPCHPDLLARYCNRLQRGVKITTSDKEILKRTHLLVDMDAKRLTGISASDGEKALAKELAERIMKDLSSRGWPAPLLLDSGNGYHLIYDIDLPNDDPSRDLLKSCLAALAARYDTEAVHVDTTVFNAARITKAYGSMARKGDSTALRPHRRSHLISAAEQKIVPVELLQALAASAPADAEKPPDATGNSFTITPEQMEKQLAMVGITHGDCQPYQNGVRWHLDHCVFDASHVATSVILGIRSNGALYYKCSHNSCQGLGWKDFRVEVERRSGKRMQFVDHRQLTEELIVTRLRNDAKAWHLYKEGTLGEFDGNFVQAYAYLITAFKRCGVKDIDQARHLLEASPFFALYTAALPEHIRKIGNEKT
jgi:hypothetical protein